MNKIHLCAGDVYLKGYINCDVEGYVLDYDGINAVRFSEVSEKNKVLETLVLDGKNPNLTTLKKYFKYPFEPDSSKRKHRHFILDKNFNPTWPDVYWETNFKENSIKEVLMVNALEHFEHNTEVPHIISNISRILTPGGVFKFDFPDIEKIIKDYYHAAPEYCMELIYCNHKNKYSVHNWGYTKKSIQNYFDLNKWQLEFKDVVKHDYPSQGVWAIKK